MHEAKTHLSRLAERASRGERITIARAGRPVAMLGPLEQDRPKRRLGVAAGKVKLNDDFNDPLPDHILEAFEGKS